MKNMGHKTHFKEFLHKFDSSNSTENVSVASTILRKIFDAAGINEANT